MRVRNISTGEVVEREGIQVCMLPLMTEDGCFVISGSRRVVVSQFVRAPGVYFSKTYDPGSGDELASSMFLPQRGTRIMMEMSGKRILTARLDNGRRFGAAALMRALGFSRDLIERALYEIDPEGLWIRPSLDAAGSMLDSEDECLVHLLGLLEPGAPSSADRGRELLRGMLMSPERLSLGDLGRKGST